MITIQREKWADCIDEIMPMCQQAFDLGENAMVGLPLDLDSDLYRMMDDADVMHCLIMRKNKKPIGLHWVFITATPRHKGRVVAQTDVIFVDQEYRKHSMLLINYSENYIKKYADLWVMSVRDYADRAKLWRRKGFKKIEQVMMRVI
ncbi:GNAT family N-acetyltransferase [Acinetobacter sp. YH12200]|uniref:GNAT family N-acetyltransferase n=1 Tax=Acinetobacter sp. YH12200 TaxID=2601139 RepID=UPI0015D27B80|nr:GNAT family N-acetyltransferase [Acinetobacter sp. YH12200]